MYIYQPQLSLSLVLDENNYVKIMDRATGDIREVQPHVMSGSCLYYGWQINSKTTRLKFYTIDWSMPSTWWEIRRLGAIFDIQVEAMPRYTTQHWRSWSTSWFQPFGAPYTFIRGAFDKRGGLKQHYFRFAECPVASTMGVLILASSKYFRGRPIAARNKVTPPSPQKGIQDI